MPLPDGHRWEWPLEEDEQAFDPRPLLPAEVEVVRCVEYRYGARRASDLARGRVLLAGDAAHTMPPFAGRDSGAGVRDAWALGALLPPARGGVRAAARAARGRHDPAVALPRRGARDAVSGGRFGPGFPAR
jgi:3-(3-hydroxy-phenyl)propionate hydroxylase